ncbi:MAG: restriction endonuclease subunit S [Finegoldia magna]|uniref:restriction endonuclease subunit S n=1 Tax=Finegoldia magna TaxID=1260 RepID=UPI002904C05E|nr:restriction endonuclease subunit S [Finegoldia magna]MDU1010462.1 restriction endonuclease subunit S [Finegoldia magna]MDU1086882.1 restriction endonuclease subunit S [Finegoldia magna]
MTRKMKDSGIEWIGEIPEEWEIVKLKYTSDSHIPHSFEDGDWIESKYISEDGIRYLTTGNIGDGEYKEQGSGYVSEENFKLLNCKYAYSGDLILSRLNAPYGRSCILPKTFDNYVISVDNVILRPSSQYDKKFINYITQCSGYQKSVEDSASGTTMQRISRTKLGNIPLAFPDVETQKIISIFLNKKTKQIEDIKNTINKEIENLENYKKSVITEAVTKGLDKNVEMKDSGIEWIGEIPKHWIKAKIKHACSIVGSGTTPKSNNLNFYSDDGNFWIQSGDLYKNSEIINTEKKVSDLALKTYSALKIYESPFLVMAMYGASVGNLSVSHIDAATNQACCVMKSNRKTNLMFLYYWLLFVQDDLLNKAEGGSQPNISQTKIQNELIYFPPINEQNDIVDYLDKRTKLIDDSIAIKQKQLETLEEYKKSLIYEYVTGKKEVKDGEES